MRTKKTLDVEVGKAGAREAGGKLLVNNFGRVKRYRDEHLVNKLMERFQPAIAGENSARRPFHRPLRRSLAQRADYQVLAFRWSSMLTFLRGKAIHGSQMTQIRSFEALSFHHSQSAWVHC